MTGCALASRPPTNRCASARRGRRVASVALQNCGFGPLQGAEFPTAKMPSRSRARERRLCARHLRRRGHRWWRADGFSARHLVDRGRLKPSGPRRKSRARGRWHDEVRIGQIRAIDASQARALPGSIVISILDGSIASTSQPSTKLSRISSSRMRRGPQSPGSRSLKHSMS